MNKHTIKLFDRWDCNIYEGDILGKSPCDKAVVPYLNFQKPITLPHTAGRYAIKRFKKTECHIVERLTNSMMMHGRNNGKKILAMNIVKDALEIINLLTNKNPLEVLALAISNGGAREDACRLGSMGSVRRQAVDVSPLRRVNQAIILITTGAREASFRSTKSIAECLADEIINASNGNNSSYAIRKKDELERVAKINR